MSAPTGPMDAARLRGRLPPLSPERVRSHEFNRTPLGRRGYDIEEVRRFLARMAEDVAASDAEKARLRAEIDRLKNYFRERNLDVDNQSRGDDGWPDVAAVNLMSRAQQAADAQVAQAEDYCRRLVAQATRQYEDILRHAAEEASRAADQARAAEQVSIDVDAGQREALEQRINWLRTFADVTRVQLRSVLEALTREVDKLDDVTSGPAPQGPRPQEAAPPGAMPQGAEPRDAGPQSGGPQSAGPQSAGPPSEPPRSPRRQGSMPQGAAPPGAVRQGPIPPATVPSGRTPAAPGSGDAPPGDRPNAG